MLRYAYQLQNYINIWITIHFQNKKIEVAKIQHNEWQYILLIRTLFNKFYKVILIVSRISNSNVHLKFWSFDVMFDHLQKIENIFQESHYYYRNFILAACETASKKLDKYYNRIWKKREIIYNFVNILYFSQKLKLYQYWNKKEVDENKVLKCDFENAYKKEFLNYFWQHYAEDDSESLTMSQFILKNNKKMRSNNAMNINWFKSNQ